VELHVTDELLSVTTWAFWHQGRLPPQCTRLTEDGDMAVTGAAEPRIQASLPEASLPDGADNRRKSRCGDDEDYRRIR
jgi:hypothetical protein